MSGRSNRSQAGREVVSVVMPTFNERESVIPMYEALAGVLDAERVDYELIFVDDDSEDGTIEVLECLRQRDAKVKFIIMSRRYGDQPCLMAGLRAAAGDVVVMMDADLQHPPACLPQMLAAWRSGVDTVMMTRETPGDASLFKKWSAILFYKIVARLADSPITERFAGFALLDRAVVDALCGFSEREPFVRGLVPWVGFRRQEMTYKESDRRLGQTKYSLARMLDLALSGLTSVSTVPLHFAIYAGLAVASVALVGTLVVAVASVVSQVSVGYWTLLIALAWLSGAQLCGIGILGIYLGKMLTEVRRRPSYIIARTAGLERQAGAPCETGS